jgi:hypothetical protein
VFISVCMSASMNLHKKMLTAIMKATMLFFNTNSSGKNIASWLYKVEPLLDYLTNLLRRNFVKPNKMFFWLKNIVITY